MTSPRLSGPVIACLAALLLSPDALFMRLSGMGGAQMLAWRAPSMALIFLFAWALTSRRRAADRASLLTGAGATVMICQFGNNVLFPTGIALAPVAVMLMGVATVPVWAAVLSRVLYGEATSRATWVTIAAVLAGIALAVTGDTPVGLDGSSLLGALCGLCTAAALALNFVTLRHNPELPLLLAMGVGGLAAGLLGIGLTGPAQMGDGAVWAILVTGLFILPVSFFSLSYASRHTPAAVVSLFMLLETVLGPLWVWLGTGEAPTPRMLAGGVIVIGALALYLRHGAREKARGIRGREALEPGPQRPEPARGP
ncbi:DMT family transporter [Roseivivax marinus]|jgi:drug/metabolite transporter (DMT)-like permease|uniref:DMT family transporter n=1 Tax=Roseivivax marinus TaxID=1379903 RepID=UPI001F0431B5|nr:DMT family transporter [Roseivivax marinus]UMA63541.1 DMT family transporter [Roseivivax marinus]